MVIARAQSGDRVALDAVLRALQAPLYAHILTIVREPADARDVLQESLMIIARKLASLRETAVLRAWAWRIATRQAVRHTRSLRRWRDALCGEGLLNNLPATEHDDDMNVLRIADLSRLLGTLSPASAVVMRMHYIDGLSHVEIAEALEIPLGTVKSRLMYGLETLRRQEGILRGK